MTKHVVHTDLAPVAIGCYSRAIKVGETVYLSGQIPLDPKTMTIVPGGIKEQVKQVFNNMKAVVFAADGQLDAIVKLTVYLVDIADTVVLNDVMTSYFTEPYPARTTIAVKALPKDALIEVDAIMAL